jgi:hypothetical protein
MKVTSTLFANHRFIQVIENVQMHMELYEASKKTEKSFQLA